MTEDARLTDFLDAGAEDGADDDPAPVPEEQRNSADGDPVAAPDDEDDAAKVGIATDADGEAAGGDDPDPERAEPAVPTADWTPDGAECAGCGAVVERRWRADDGFVCTDCRQW